MESIIISITPFVQGLCLGSLVTFVWCVVVVLFLMWLANRARAKATELRG